MVNDDDDQINSCSCWPSSNKHWVISFVFRSPKRLVPILWIALSSERMGEGQGFFYRPIFTEISEISFLSTGSDKI